MPVLDAAIRGERALDSHWLIVNHDSHGAVPKPVLAARQDWRRQMEVQPTRFSYPAFPGLCGKLLPHSARLSEDIAFITEAAEGCNALLRSLASRRRGVGPDAWLRRGAQHDALYHGTRQRAHDGSRPTAPRPARMRRVFWQRWRLR